MGLIEQEIKELRAMQKQVLKGELSPEAAMVQLGFFNQTAKRISQLIQITAMATKSSKAYTRIVQANVIGDGEAIDVSGETCMKCPAQGDALIGREECLDYSGQERHLDVCQDCTQFGKTRRALLPT